VLEQEQEFSLKENQVEDIDSFTLHWCICFGGKKKKGQMNPSQLQTIIVRE
jgi:hypothetical protein